MKKVMLLLVMLAVLVMVAAAPVMAQEEKKGKDKEKKAEKKEMPKTGGIPVNTAVIGLGAGALLVGSGLLVRKVTR